MCDVDAEGYPFAKAAPGAAGVMYAEGRGQKSRPMNRALPRPPWNKSFVMGPRADGCGSSSSCLTHAVLKGKASMQHTKIRTCASEGRNR